LIGTGISIKKNLNYIRIILSFCLILIAIYNYEVFIQSPLFSLIYIFLVLISNIVFLFVPPHFFKSIRLHYIIFLLDVFLIVSGIALFIKFDIPFLIAIFLTMFMAALSKSSGLSFFIALVVNIIYLYIKVGLKVSIDIFNENFLMNLPFIFIVAIHSTYLAENVEQETEEKLQLEKINKFLAKKSINLKEKITDIIDFMGNIINSMNTGVIFIDNDGMIRLFNGKCEEIFNLKNSDIINKPLKECKLPENFTQNILDVIFGNKDIKGRFELKIGDDKYIMNYIVMNQQEINGILCEIFKL